MKNKKLIERFIKDNFNLANFNLTWKSEWVAELTDINGSTLTLCTFNPYQVWTSIDGVHYLDYRLITHTPTGTEVWEVINDKVN